jgi:hypothetical protein
MIGETSHRPVYVAGRALSVPGLDAAENGCAWDAAVPAPLQYFHHHSSEHRPQTLARVLYDPQSLYVEFTVHDRFVRCVHLEDQEAVYKDSCVEFFVQPKAGYGHFNFEVNCGGALLLYYVEDGRPAPGGQQVRFRPLEASFLQSVRIWHSLPRRIEPEIDTPLDWRVALAIPLTLFEACVGEVAAVPEAIWRCNFYKCGDETSHPHWAAWSPIGNELNFHQPEYFGELRFGPQTPQL